jgi:hypothetical protein
MADENTIFDFFKNTWNKPPESVDSFCVNEAIGNAIAYRNIKGVDTRIIEQVIDKEKNQNHFQAEALINGEWKPLGIRWDAAKGRNVIEAMDKRSYDIEPNRILGLEDAFNEQMKVKDTLNKK